MKSDFAILAGNIKEKAKVVIARSNKESRVPLTICIIVFLVTFFVNNDFEIGYIFNYAFVSGFIALSLIFDGRIHLGRINLVYLFLTAVVVLFSFMPNSVMDPESNNHAISIIMFFLCCGLSMPSTSELYKTKKLINFSALLMAIYIIAIKLVPDIYWDYIYPYLSSYTQSQARSLMRYYNYGVPIGGSANYADYILALGIFICLGNMFSGYVETKEERRYVLLSILFIVAMVIQNRRSELFSVVLTLLLMYSLSVNLRFIESKRFRRAIGAIVLVIAVIVFMYSRGMLDRYIDTFIALSLKSGGGLEEVGNGRVVLWSVAYNKFKSSPIIGIGWNQFRATNDIRFMQGINVHNDYLQWLCETGLVGFILICVPTVYLWVKALSRSRLLFKKKTAYSNEAKSYVLISCGIQTFFMIMHFMDPCFYKLMFWPMFAFSIILYNRSVSIERRIESTLL